jgi:hypothetical protein
VLEAVRVTSVEFEDAVEVVGDVGADEGAQLPRWGFIPFGEERAGGVFELREPGDRNDKSRQHGTLRIVQILGVGSNGLVHRQLGRGKETSVVDDSGKESLKGVGHREEV